jgi:site-specific recombinase XerD
MRRRLSPLGLAPDNHREASLNIENVCAEFLDYCERERHLAAHTIAAYEQDLAEFSKVFVGRDVKEIIGSELVA